jgi:hypothetical protein
VGKVRGARLYPTHIACVKAWPEKATVGEGCGMAACLGRTLPPRLPWFVILLAVAAVPESTRPELACRGGSVAAAPSLGGAAPGLLRLRGGGRRPGAGGGDDATGAMDGGGASDEDALRRELMATFGDMKARTPPSRFSLPRPIALPGLLQRTGNCASHCATGHRGGRPALPRGGVRSRSRHAQPGERLL